MQRQPIENIILGAKEHSVLIPMGADVNTIVIIAMQKVF
jgi:hypothetical protein